MLNQVNIGLFITGGIASYKMGELARQLIKKGANVRVVMSESAQKFITPLTLQTLTKHSVLTDTFDEHDPASIQHINIADWLDLALVAPATANIIGKMANGISDDAVSSTLMAVNNLRVIVPAMNTKMFDNPATQANISRLESFGYVVMEPDEGFLAEGYSGKGRMPSVEDIVEMVEYQYMRHNSPQWLEGQKVVVTAGGTVERIDPVRYISNDSSGQMGYAMARAASFYGADVTLISTKRDLKVPHNIAAVYVDSAVEMQQELNKYFLDTNYVVMAAAVSDYRVLNRADQKIKKEAGSDNSLQLDLAENPDILATLGKEKKNQVLIGFAAETENLFEYASGKLRKKNANWIIANDVSNKGIGFNSTHNEVLVIGADGTYEEISVRSKLNVSLEIWRIVLDPNHTTN
ncbi:bifunctional phosphopantothenoylcysteine decarboxylase/phosphopantothenate--cysteine ligase CoaBC [Ruoffia tabacinasalis]|uniref:bifunctional phosphopantothenoylcysteine decarboxylase/phosphopantothenate--cysteine ligase CoaBC n=1 Tax=Ruoffia tabacinasalis TaxID=87458 RepID=UPI003F99B90E